MRREKPVETDRHAISKGAARRLDESLKREARQSSRRAADRLLSSGFAVSYREKDTPPDCVLRRHPDGRIETVRIELGRTKATASG